MSMLQNTIKLTLALYNNHHIPAKQLMIFKSYVPYLQKKIAIEFYEVPDSSIIDRVNLVMEENKNPLKPLSIEHLRFKHYERSCGFVNPESYEIGTELIFEIVSSLVICVKRVKRYSVFMPIRNTWKNFLETPNLFHEVMSYTKSFENENFIVSNIIQGSHSGEKELGVLYLGLPFLSPHLVAKLTNIYAVGHRKSIGSKRVCHKVIDELNKLCRDGIALNTNGTTVTVYFRCPLVLGDNLGLNCICDFVESFSATRTVQNYGQDVQKKSITTGVKTECVFNQLIYFHIVENRTLDIMHDLFEGVVHYTLSKILTCLIFGNKLLSLDMLNRRISEFYFGEVEINKPRPIYKESAKVNVNDIVKNKIKIKQSSAEMLCLCRYLGVIIGDLIPGNNRYWKLYLTLREIIGIVTAPRYNIADISQLRFLVHLHNESYIQLFGKLKPKMHFLIHFAEIMLDNGPVIHFWSMPYERRNKILKEIAISSRSHRNISLMMEFVINCSNLTLK
ncbi:hypothetical protein TSAR_007607 [Trichomalopsis sarcophagae]|uniref:DUF4218 domain-containing protein n=1 Tax=Trichomalopsis sarcophagae TaxID=543379 RepID=A0A232EFT6_9HYME|nr:hypothetical protein TSAR_007607 [Trichomalopsis sarcophagae]